MAGMVIQHNMNAINAYNKLNYNVKGMKNSSEKLASGYRINRAGDDAAGLAISEKMRSQIKGLNQAIRNSQDGINMIQTFEGAAQQTHNILQRMKELASESANGTYDNTTDRDAIELEFRQLNDELNQISDTDFNGRVALNGGRMADGTIATNNLSVAGKPVVATNEVLDISSNFVYHGGVNGFVDRSGNGTINIDGVTLKLYSGANTTGLTVGDTKYYTNEPVNFGTTTINANADPANKPNLIAKSVFALTKDTTEITIYGETYSIKYATDPANNKLVDSEGHELDQLYGNDIDFTTTQVTITRYYNIAQGGDVYSKVAHASSLNNYADADVTVVCGHIDLSVGVSHSDAFMHGRRNLTYADSVALQVGSRSKDLVNFTFEYVTSGIGDLTADLDISSRGLGTDQLTLVTAEKANEAIDHIDNAINKTSMVRATFGAMQNRLEYKIESLTTNTENITEAESNIRDTDMASEMMTFTKFNILQQAAQSMLSQANQQPQSILQLLGG